MNGERSSVGAPSTCELTISVAGRTEKIEHRPGTTILQAARSAGLRPPSSCEAGSCATCMARVVDGRAHMRTNDVLDPDEVAEGWVLTCQADPASPTITVIYE